MNKRENGKTPAHVAPNATDVAAAISNFEFFLQEFVQHHLNLTMRMQDTVRNIREMATEVVRNDGVRNAGDGEEEQGAFSVGNFVRIRNPPPRLQGVESFGRVIGFTETGFVRIELRGGQVLRRLPHNLDLIN